MDIAAQLARIADALVRQAVDTFAAVLDPTHPDLSQTRVSLAHILLRTHKPLDALDQARLAATGLQGRTRQAGRIQSLARELESKRGYFHVHVEAAWQADIFCRRRDGGPLG